MRHFYHSLTYLKAWKLRGGRGQCAYPELVLLPEITFLPGLKGHSYGAGWSHRSVGKVHALHIAHLGLILDNSYGH